jgi:hypothetical protein
LHPFQRSVAARLTLWIHPALSRQYGKPIGSGERNALKVGRCHRLSSAGVRSYKSALTRTREAVLNELGEISRELRLEYEEGAGGQTPWSGRLARQSREALMTCRFSMSIFVGRSTEARNDSSARGRPSVSDLLGDAHAAEPGLALLQPR